MPDSINTLTGILHGATLSALTAALRVIYDNEKTRAHRVLLESALCGALTVTAGFGLEAMGASVYWTLFAGGTIGGLGSTVTRTFARKLIAKKACKK